MEDKLANKAPEVIVYTKPSLPRIFKQDKKSIGELREDIMLQIQGDSVEVSDKNNLLALLILLDVAYKYCPELVISLKGKKKILIFDHQSVPVLRSEDIISGIYLEIPEKKGSKPVNKVDIKIKELCKGIKGKDEIDKLNKCIKTVSGKLKPAKKIYFVGMGNAAVFLFCQYYAYSLAEEIWYQKDKSSEPIKINT